MVTRKEAQEINDALSRIEEARKQGRERLMELGVSIMLILPSAAWAGYVASRLWDWFAAPIGAPHLSVFRAAGFLLIEKMVQGIRLSDRKDDRPLLSLRARIRDTVLAAVVAPAVFLLVGAVFRQWA